MNNGGKTFFPLLKIYVVNADFFVLIFDLQGKSYPEKNQGAAPGGEGEEHRER